MWAVSARRGRCRNTARPRGGHWCAGGPRRFLRHLSVLPCNGSPYVTRHLGSAGVISVSPDGSHDRPFPIGCQGGATRKVARFAACDLRGAATVRKKLKRERTLYEQLTREQKGEYDHVRFTNPFSDTRMYARDPKKPVRRVLAGIDIEAEEVLLAHELSREKPIDLIIAHHPVGSALAGLHEVMELQAEVLAKYGVPITIAESLINRGLLKKAA